MERATEVPVAREGNQTLASHLNIENIDILENELQRSSVTVNHNFGSSIQRLESGSGLIQLSQQDDLTLR